MRIYTEIRFETLYLGVATLENGVRLLVRPDGTAEGSDGKTYAHVGLEDNGALLDLGWTADAARPVVLDKA